VRDYERLLRISNSAVSSFASIENKAPTPPTSPTSPTYNGSRGEGGGRSQQQGKDGGRLHGVSIDWILKIKETRSSAKTGKGETSA
jgi:hypothetical protein